MKMENPNKQEETQRIVLERDSGMYDNNGVGVYYDISCEDEELFGSFNISKDNPGYFCFNIESNLCIFIHKSVPREFVEVVFFHELTEAKFISLGRDNPNQMALDEENKYLKKYFTDEQITRFRTWSKTIRLF